jgi:F-type H+-transporting ATPase subunit delta
MVVETAARLRWSRPWDLVDGLEDIADDALFAAAEKNGSLDEVEDELFRFERILAAQSPLTTLLDELTVPAERRVGLLRDLLGRKVQPVTEQLLEHAVASGRKRSIELAIDDLLDAGARRRERSVARVLSAVPLTTEQETRLASVLSTMYGRPISVRSAVDPTVQGGLVIRVGDELIDGSIATRFATARSQLAG